MIATITCTGCSHGYAESALFCPNCGRPKVRQAADDRLVGKLLGERFQVQAVIGQGGSGTIYRAEHVTLRRRVAIKVLHDELSRDDLAVERFRREATTVADIDNEHIVEIHDFGRTPDGRLYLAMELLEGETLDAVIARDQLLSIERTADILIQVGEALMEAHAIGYVHRDLRPRNIYLTTRRGKANFVKLLDFGLAKLVETDTAAPQTSVGMTFGDPRYMSPEQARGDQIDLRADIYQLGCVAFEMLTGTPPFVGTKVFDILTRQVTEAPAPLPTRRPGVPLWLEAAVAKMLAKDPANRFATTSRMVEALRLGVETGEVMDDELALRRESVPPPSVSRVMERMGISPDDAPLPPLASPVSAAPVAAAAAPVAPAAVVPSAALDDAGLPPRRSTGTPKVGVPVVSAVSAAPAASTGARRASSEADAANLSQVWYDEGDRVSEDGVGDRHGFDLSSSAADLSMYDEEPARGRRWGLIIGVLAVLIVGGTVAFALTRGGDEQAAEPNVEVANLTAPIDAAPSTIVEVVDAGSAAVPSRDVATPAPPRRSSGGHSSSSNSSGNSGGRTTTSGTSGGDIMSFVPGGDETFRRPGGDPARPVTTNPVVTNPTNPIVTPYDPPKDAGSTGVSGANGPVDPYGGGGATTPVEGASGEQKAVFFANLGQQQLMAGETATAASSFKKALELDGRNATAVTGMGEIALRQGLFGDAIAHLKKASRLAPRNARVFTLLGEAYLNSGNNAEAAQNFKRALQIQPDNARAREGYNEASSKVPPPEDD